MSQESILVYLKNKGGWVLSKVVKDELKLSPSSVSVALNKLHGQKLVERRINNDISNNPNHAVEWRII